MRSERTPRTSSSCSARHVSPASSSSFVTVLIDTSVMRLIERIETPSHRLFRIMTRLARGSLFMPKLYADQSSILYQFNGYVNPSLTISTEGVSLTRGAMMEPTLFDAPAPDEPPRTPGDALREWMQRRDWSQSDLAYVLGVNNAAVNQILQGKRGISADMAKALAVAFDLPLDTFVKLQAEWELQRARDPDPAVGARAKIQSEYPLREMMKRGWINGEADVEGELCRFFDAKSLDDVPRLAHAAHRTATDEIPASQLAWLYRVRQIARE